MDHARYYSAGVILAFEHLHRKMIIYRDLKPENVLLDEHGRPKLTDMGLAKYVVGMTHTFCGTPAYIAPEIVKHAGHTMAVDWWCLGVFVYELMSGGSPFDADTPVNTYKKVARNKVLRPTACGGSDWDLIKSLLKSEPGERLPARPGGIENLISHQWFAKSAKFDWEEFRNCKLKPPYMPKGNGKKIDADNFNVDSPAMTGDEHADEYQDDGSGWDRGFATVSEEVGDPLPTKKIDSGTGGKRSGKNGKKKKGSAAAVELAV